MTIATKTIKLFGQKNTVYQVLNSKGEVVKVAATREEAEAFIAA